MAEYIIFKDYLMKDFFEEIKTKTGLNYTDLADYLKIKKSMITHYVKNRCKLKYDYFRKLCQLANLSINNYSFSIKIFNIEKEVTLPKLNQNLAEFIGIMLGDGHLDPYNYGIIITEGQIDYPYIKYHIPYLIKNLFKLEGKFKPIKEGDCKIQCYIYSKIVFNFLNKTYKIQAGKKINPEIPLILFRNKNFLKACIRGLIDTDGGVYRHHKKSIQLAFYNSKISLINSVKKAFKTLGFHPKLAKDKHKYIIYIFTEDVKKYFSEIGSNNLKNNLKYNFWIREGKVPNHDIISKFIK